MELRQKRWCTLSFRPESGLRSDLSPPRPGRTEAKRVHHPSTETPPCSRPPVGYGVESLWKSSRDRGLVDLKAAWIKAQPVLLVCQKVYKEMVHQGLSPGSSKQTAQTRRKSIFDAGRAAVKRRENVEPRLRKINISAHFLFWALIYDLRVWRLLCKNLQHATNIIQTWLCCIGHVSSTTCFAMWAPLHFPRPSGVARRLGFYPTPLIQPSMSRSLSDVLLGLS